jgi:hypothetical protein
MIIGEIVQQLEDITRGLGGKIVKQGGISTDIARNVELKERKGEAELKISFPSGGSGE